MHNQVDVLIVTADSQTAEIISRGFATILHPCNCRTLTDPDEALELLTCAGAYSRFVQSDRPRLVLLDLHLQNGAGLKLLKTLKGNESTRSIPIVAITTSRDERELVDAYDAGVNSFIVRPDDEKRFVEEAKVLARYWLDLNQPMV